VKLQAGEKKEIRFKAKEETYFPWGDSPWKRNRRLGMTYEYTIWTESHFLDPDIEINR